MPDSLKTPAGAMPGARPISTLEEVIAYIAIRQRVMEYCRGVDRGYVEAITAAYHPDGFDDHGAEKGRPIDFAAHIVEALDGPGIIGQHHITNTVVDIKGTFAKAESYYLCFHPLIDPETGQARILHTGGRYLDEFEQRGGQWKITRRKVLMDFARVEDGYHSWAGMSAFPRSGRREDDPSAIFFLSE